MYVCVCAFYILMKITFCRSHESDSPFDDRDALLDIHLILNYDSVTICDGSEKVVRCPKKENIHVLQGFYGKWKNHDCYGVKIDPTNSRTCSKDRKETTKVVRDSCQGQNQCTFVADRTIYGNPCPKSDPYLYVTFFCMEPGKKIEHQKDKNNQEVVTVTTHGFLVSEKKHLPAATGGKKKKTPPPEVVTAPVAQPESSISSSSRSGSSSKSVDVKASELTDEASIDIGKPLEVTKEFIKEKEKEKQSSKEVEEDPTVEGKPSHDQIIETSSALLPNIEKAITTAADLSTNHLLKEKLTPAAEIEEEPRSKSTLPSVGDEEPDSNSVRREEILDRMLRTATICNGQSKLIACLPEEGIKLSGAFYGKRSGKDCHGDLPYKDDSPTCSALDAKSKIQEECNGKQTCLLFADENVYGKSLCPNVNKYLHVDYFCFPRSVLDDIAAKKIHAALQEDLEEDAVSRSTDPTIQGKQNMTVQICNGERHAISCKKDVGMQITQAFYGKQTGKDCRGELGYRDDIPECSNPRALDSVKFLCENRKSCELAAEKELFGDDTCPGVNKYLRVTYEC